MSVNVSLIVWESVGEEKETRALECKAFSVNEKQLYLLPEIAFDLGVTMVEGMALEIVGHRRSGIPHERSD